MEYLDSVAPEDIPEEALSTRSRPETGWHGLVSRVIEDSRAGRVTVLKFKDHDEYRKMRNGTAAYFRKVKFTVEARVLRKPDGYYAYMLAQPEQQQLEITRTRPVETPPVVRRTPVGNRSNSQHR